MNSDNDKENFDQEMDIQPKKKRRQMFVYKSSLEETCSGINVGSGAEEKKQHENLKNLVLEKLCIIESNKVARLPFASPTNPVVFEKLFSGNKELSRKLINDLMDLTEKNLVTEISCNENYKPEITKFSKTSLVFNCVCQDGTKMIVVFLCSPHRQFEKELSAHNDGIPNVVYIAVCDYLFDERKGWIKNYTCGKKLKLIVVEVLSFCTSEIFKSDTHNNHWGFFLKLADCLSSDDLDKHHVWNTLLGQAFNTLRLLEWSFPELARYEQFENQRSQFLMEQRALEEVVISEEKIIVYQEMIAKAIDPILAVLSTGLPVKLAKYLQASKFNS